MTDEDLAVKMEGTDDKTDYMTDIDTLKFITIQTLTIVQGSNSRAAAG